jgi:hypothetical protein
MSEELLVPLLPKNGRLQPQWSTAAARASPPRTAKRNRLRAAITPALHHHREYSDARRVRRLPHTQLAQPLARRNQCLPRLDTRLQPENPFHTRMQKGHGYGGSALLAPRIRQPSWLPLSRHKRVARRRQSLKPYRHHVRFRTQVAAGRKPASGCGRSGTQRVERRLHTLCPSHILRAPNGQSRFTAAEQAHSCYLLDGTKSQHSSKHTRKGRLQRNLQRAGRHDRVDKPGLPDNEIVLISGMPLPRLQRIHSRFCRLSPKPPRPPIQTQEPGRN